MFDRRNVTIAAMVGAVCGGCAGTTALAPAPAANSIPELKGAAVERAAGVRVLAQGDAWPGREEITTEVTPLRVVIQNGSDRPVAIRYSEFELVGPAGTRYAAIPPLAVEGDITEPVPIAAPRFVYTGFAVAPYHAGFYPTVPMYPGPFAWDGGYYRTHWRYWAEIELPTPMMLERALPEGVLEPGGRVDGFLYFAHVDDDVGSVDLRVTLMDARTDEHFGELRIPFVVAE